MIELKMPYPGREVYHEVCSTLRQDYILQPNITLRINNVEYTENTMEYRRAFFEERMKERMWGKLSD